MMNRKFNAAVSLLLIFALPETLKENLTTVSDDSLMSEYPTRQGSINCTKILYDH